VAIHGYDPRAIDASENQLKSNQEWIRWGTYDPLFGVAAWPDHERGGSQAWTDEAFYELGRSDWADFISRWINYGVNTSTCVEIGSGTGRLTKFMAETFDQLYAVDISADMLEYAKRNIDAKNVTFVVTNGRVLPFESRFATAAFSTYVFQHFASTNDGAGYFAELARVLADDGSLMIHAPMHAFPDAGRLTVVMRSLNSAGKLIRGFKTTCRQFTSSLIRVKPPMRWLSYELSWISHTLSELGFVDVEFMAFPVNSNGRLHSFVLARKAGPASKAT
jgi:SAM-dependent methyltransferase